MKNFIMAAVAAFFLSACATTEAPAEIVPLFPEGRVLSGTTLVCDTEESAREIWDTHVTEGWQAGAQVFAGHNRAPGLYRGPLCGLVRGNILLVRVLASATAEWPDGPRPMNLAEMRGPDGNKYWAILTARKPKPQGIRT